MADRLPDTLELRDIKYGERVSPERRVKVGMQLLEAGRIYDALDLFLLAGNDAGVQEVCARAVKHGLPALLLALKRAGRPPSLPEWTAAAEKAFAEGRFREAFRCFREAGDEAGLERVREKLPGYDLYTPQGK